MARAVTGPVTRYRPWARPAPARAPGVHRLRWRDDPLPSGGGPFLAFGNGRSYGDSCLVAAGTLVDVRGLDRFISFDAESGVLRCESGVLLAEILAFAVPRGWFVPVTPGTRMVTVGGAIANDVHGKNHHRAGSFGHHVRRFELLRSDGTRLICSEHSNRDWFEATIGGLGLTGVIAWAEIALNRVASPAMLVESLRFSSLESFFELSRQSHERYEYVVAWIDGLAPSRGGVRGLLFRANHATDDAVAVAPPRTLPGLPFTPPFSLLPRRAVGAFNALVYHRPRRRHAHQHFERFFYPLDGVAHWNRLFGPRGFHQHQLVAPPECAYDAVSAAIERVRRAAAGSFLSVLKVFGDRRPRGWLSFARPGVTVALDLPDRGAATARVLDDLDAIAIEAGGAVYPAKDARMGPEVFERGFPRWSELERYRDPAFSSSFWRRVTRGRA